MSMVLGGNRGFTVAAPVENIQREKSVSIRLGNWQKKLAGLNKKEIVLVCISDFII